MKEVSFPPKLPCYETCPFGHRACHGNFIHEEPYCDKAIVDQEQWFKDRGYTVLIFINNWFGYRLLDANSEIRPLPKIADIEIVNGELRIKD